MTTGTMKVVAVLAWHGFPSRSQVPTWIRSLLLSLPEDALRRFLIFVCGTPSLPAPAAGKVRGRGGEGRGGEGVVHSFGLPCLPTLDVGFFVCVCARLREALLCAPG